MNHSSRAFSSSSSKLSAVSVVCAVSSVASCVASDAFVSSVACVLASGSANGLSLIGLVAVLVGETDNA